MRRMTLSVIRCPSRNSDPPDRTAGGVSEVRSSQHLLSGETPSEPLAPALLKADAARFGGPPNTFESGRLCVRMRSEHLEAYRLPGRGVF